MTNHVPPEAADLVRGARVMAHLATCADGRPHAAPVWYVYHDGTASDATGGASDERSEPDGGVVELVTGGRKLANVRANPKVALSLQKDVEGATQWTVTLLGTATVVDDEEQFRAANRRINEKYGADPDAHADNALVRVEVGSASYRTY